MGGINTVGTNIRITCEIEVKNETSDLTMKTIILLAVIAFVAADPEFYTYEEMDINKLVNNLNDLKEFTNCLLENIPCNKVYESYRVHTLEAIQQSCKRCTPHVKYMFWRYLQGLKANLPWAYISLRQKYDPENKYFDANEAELNKYSHE